MSENIIKEGDFVRVRGRETSCEVLIAKEGINAIAVEETRKYATTYNREEVERIDPKTAFLHDLSELLRKYDANINFGFSVEERTCGVLFDIKDERIFYPFKVDEMEDTLDTIWRLPGSNYPLTPDNVLNYDKE